MADETGCRLSPSWETAGIGLTQTRPAYGACPAAPKGTEPHFRRRNLGEDGTMNGKPMRVILIRSLLDVAGWDREQISRLNI
jgi:hypothetical protein